MAKIKPISAGWMLAGIYLLCIPAFMFAQSHALARRFFWVVLLASFIVLLCFHKKWSREFVIAMLLIGGSGFLLEVLAVKTGYVYGYFLFGPALGYRFWETPVLLAAIWAGNIYSSRQIAAMVANDTFVVSLVSAALVTLLLFFMEPFAVREGMWSWNGPSIPRHRYIGVFIATLVFQYIFSKSVKLSANKLALPAYLVQLGFFVAMFLLRHAA